MKLRDVTFERWVATSEHSGKPSRERWRRELYPWPVIADVDYSSDLVGIPQYIRHDGADYLVALTETPVPAEERHLGLFDPRGLRWAWMACAIL
jgi:hypothetical protein